MSKVNIYLANGFEEIEGLTVVDLLRRAQIEITMVSITGEKKVTGSHGISTEADCLFEEAGEADAYVLPGGMPGTNYLAAHTQLGEVLTKAAADGKIVAAICAAPMVLGKLGLLNGKKAICYPGMEENLIGAQVTVQSVVTDGNITTSRGMGTAIDFALSLVSQLKDAETAENLGKSIVYL